MGNHEPLLGSLSNRLDADDIGWDDDEEIELESEEHDLFLRHSYTKPSNNDILPFLNTSPSEQPNLRQSTMSRSFQNTGSGSATTSDLAGIVNANGTSDKVESFHVRDGRNSPPSVVYQMPNYDQFAGNLAPSSPTSIVVSMIIIIVILSVTIVPKVFPQITNDPSDQVINGNHNSQPPAKEHADVRCKCICPPSQQTSHDNSTNNQSQRRLYVGNTTPNQCNCNNIVQPHYNDTKIPLKEFCVLCECRYQSRNTSTIRRNVIFYIAVLIGLALYMFIQYLLKYLRITRRSIPRQLRWLSHQTSEGG